MGEESCLQDHLTVPWAFMGVQWTFQPGAISVMACLAAELTLKMEICDLSNLAQAANCSTIAVSSNKVFVLLPAVTRTCYRGSSLNGYPQ